MLLLVRSLHQKIIAWGGLCGNGSFLGPFFFDNNVNGMPYFEILIEEILPTLVLLLPVTIWILWWTQDGTPVHYFREINHCFKEVF